MPAIERLRSASGRLAHATRTHSRLIGGGVAAAFTAVLAMVAARRHRSETVTLPDPAGLATETAVSVHNAAKSTMLSAARAADAPDLALITRTVQEAITDATEAGVDLVSVAIGVTSGAAEVTHLFDRPHHEVMTHAVTASVDAAAASGATAASRVRDALAGLSST